MTLDDEDTGKGLQLVPESYGMDVPSACTIVIISGKLFFYVHYALSQGWIKILILPPHPKPLYRHSIC